MIAYQEECLDLATIKNLLSGKMPDERFQVALEHLEACEKCRAKAEESGELSVQFVLGKLGNKGLSYESEPQCVAAINEIIAPPRQENSSVPITRNELERIGGYRVSQLIGAGGMGSVFQGEHERLRRRVAIKILSAEKLSRPGWLERFDREMTSIAALEHPNVVRALDAGEEQQLHYLVMEYLDGLDIGKVVRRVADLSVADACEIARQAALGLGAIHQGGMVHRDVKPSNLFLTREGIVKLLDLGLVLDGESPMDGDERLTTVGHLMGTIPYMPREQLSDSSQVDHRADLYSLGATLFRLLTGKSPYGKSGNLAETIQCIHSENCRPLSSLRADLPPGLVELVEGLLSHEPAKRPSSASQVAEALEPFAKGHRLKELLRVAEQQSDEILSYSMPFGSQVGQSPDRSNKSTRSFWLALAAIPFFVVSGVLLTLATDSGDLIIRSDVDDVSIVVKSSGKVVDRLTVDAAVESKIRLWSGKYQVEIESESNDRIVIDREQVAILRGDDEIVSITQVRSSGSQNPNPGIAATAAGLPSFEGNANSASNTGRNRTGFLGQTGDVPIAGDFDGDGMEEIGIVRGNRVIVDSDGDGEISDQDRFFMLDSANGSVLAGDFDGDGKDEPVAPRLSGTGRIFQGKTFDHWLSILSREQDSATLAEAMEAVSLLAEDDSEQLAAAGEMLRPARQHGGVVLSRRSKPSAFGNKPEYSQWYMSDLKDWFPKIPVAIQLRAVEKELRDGNSKSAIACVMVLHELTIAEIREAKDGTKVSPPYDELFSRLRDIVVSWQERIASLGEYAMEASELRVAEGMAVSLRIRLRLGSQPADGCYGLKDDPQIVAWSETNYRQALERLECWEEAFDTNPASALSLTYFDYQTAIPAYGALSNKETDVRPFCIGLLNDWGVYDYLGTPTPVSSDKVMQATRLSILKQLQRKDPAGFAEAIRLHLKSMLQPKNGIQVSGIAGNRLLDKSLASTALDGLSQHEDPLKLLMTLAQLKSQAESLDTGYPPEQLDAMTDQMIFRLATEADDEQEDLEERLAYAIRAAYERDVEIPLGPFLAKYRRQQGYAIYGFVNTGTWPQKIDTMLSSASLSVGSAAPVVAVADTPPSEKPKKLWSFGTTDHYIREFIHHKPESVIDAVLSELVEGNSASMFHISFSVADALNNGHWDRFMEASEGKEKIRQLAERFSSKSRLDALNIETLKAFSFEGSSDEAIRKQGTVWLVGLSCRLSAAVEDKPTASAASYALSYLRSVAQEKLDKDLFLGAGASDVFSQLPYLSEAHSISLQTRFELLLRLAWSDSEIEPGLQEFIADLYGDSPEGFRELVLNHIQANDTEPFLGFAKLLTYQSKREHVWQEIVKRIVKNEKARLTLTREMQRLFKSAASVPEKLTPVGGHGDPEQQLMNVIAKLMDLVTLPERD